MGNPMHDIEDRVSAIEFLLSGDNISRDLIVENAKLEAQLRQTYTDLGEALAEIERLRY